MEACPKVVLATAYQLVWPHLDERQRRLLLAAGTRGLGREVTTAVARATGASRQTVPTALAELDDPAASGRLPTGRIRRPDGGRKRLSERDPDLLGALDALADPDTRGDPESPLRWTCKSTAQLARALTTQGHPVSDDTVGWLLKQQGYTLQRTRKTVEGAQHPDRDAQFGYLNEQAAAHLADGQPVVSVAADRLLVTADAGDKELAEVPLARHDFHGEWNYTITPRAGGCVNKTTFPTS